MSHVPSVPTGCSLLLSRYTLQFGRARPPTAIGMQRHAITINRRHRPLRGSMPPASLACAITQPNRHLLLQPATVHTTLMPSSRSCREAQGSTSGDLPAPTTLPTQRSLIPPMRYRGPWGNEYIMDTSTPPNHPCKGMSPKATRTPPRKREPHTLEIHENKMGGGPCRPAGRNVARPSGPA